MFSTQSSESIDAVSPIIYLSKYSSDVSLIISPDFGINFGSGSTPVLFKKCT